MWVGNGYRDGHVEEGVRGEQDVGCRYGESEIGEGEDFWKEKDKTFYEEKEDYERSEEYGNVNVSQDDKISRKTTFSEQELAKKREWIK